MVGLITLSSLVKQDYVSGSIVILAVFAAAFFHAVNAVPSARSLAHQFCHIQQHPAGAWR